MSFKLHKPGTRHGNKVYYATISVKGRRSEISTGTTDPRLARRFAEQREREWYEHYVLGGSEETVSSVIANYIAFRRPSLRDERLLLKIRGMIGQRPVAGLRQADFDECAQALYPGLSNATWNKYVYTPLQAALRHSGVNVPIKRPRLKKPRHQSLTAKQRDILIENADDADLKALLTLLFYSGPRISEAIGLTRERTDLQKGIACFELTKTNDQHWRPLHEKVVVALASLPERDDGKWFRWKTRWGPRKLIKELSEKTGVYFHPHIGRHTFADLVMEKGASLRDLMDAGGWKDPKSAMRYTTKRVERVRKVVNKL